MKVYIAGNNGKAVWAYDEVKPNKIKAPKCESMKDKYYKILAC